MKRADIVFGDGIIIQEGERWQTQRRRMAYSFAHSFIARFAQPIATLAQAQLENIEGDKKEFLSTKGAR